MDGAIDKSTNFRPESTALSLSHSLSPHDKVKSFSLSLFLLPMFVVQWQGQVAVQRSRREEKKNKGISTSWWSCRRFHSISREYTSMKIIHSINFCACEVERIQIREHRLQWPSQSVTILFINHRARTNINRRMFPILNNQQDKQREKKRLGEVQVQHIDTWEEIKTWW